MSSETRETKPHYVAPVEGDGLGAIDAVRVSERTSNLWIDAWRDLRGRPMFWISAVLIVFIMFVALFPSVLTAEDPTACALANSDGGPSAGHPFGFTRQGCDVFSRTLHGASTSVAVGILASLIVAVVGIAVGAFAGFYGTWVDSVLMRLGDIFFAIPYILAAVVVMSVFSEVRSIPVIALAIGGFSWPSTARILRSEVLRVKQLDFVMASTALGLSKVNIMFRHVLPNSIAPVIVTTTIGLAAAITAEATLSFLGVGIPNVVSWGNDISQAQVNLRTNPMALVYPSLALSVTVLAFIMLGETVRDALDPKSRATR